MFPAVPSSNRHQPHSLNPLRLSGTPMFARRRTSPSDCVTIEGPLAEQTMSPRAPRLPLHIPGIRPSISPQANLFSANGRTTFCRHFAAVFDSPMASSPSLASPRNVLHSAPFLFPETPSAHRRYYSPVHLFACRRRTGPPPMMRPLPLGPSRSRDSIFVLRWPPLLSLLPAPSFLCELVLFMCIE